MSIAEKIGPHIPYLRRFARALTGSQGIGDGYVAAVLEALVNEPETFPDIADARIALYRLFCSTWTDLEPDVSVETELTPHERAAQAHLKTLDPMLRQAFLLRTVEAFSLDEVCLILDLPRKKVVDLIDQVGREIAEMVATDVLIIEDEPMISMDLEALVDDLGHSVTGVARTHSQAVDSAHKSKPGLVLADIQLADGSSGLNAVNEILTSFEVPVIFITAYPERFLSGKRPEPAFLITKPFQEEQVKAMISQALFFNASAQRA